MCKGGNMRAMGKCCLDCTQRLGFLLAFLASLLLLLPVCSWLGYNYTGFEVGGGLPFFFDIGQNGYRLYRFTTHAPAHPRTRPPTHSCSVQGEEA